MFLSSISNAPLNEYYLRPIGTSLYQTNMKTIRALQKQLEQGLLDIEQDIQRKANNLSRKKTNKRNLFAVARYRTGLVRRTSGPPQKERQVPANLGRGHKDLTENIFARRASATWRKGWGVPD